MLALPSWATPGSPHAVRRGRKVRIASSSEEVRTFFFFLLQIMR
jgi:hypothetical protein